MLTSLDETLEAMERELEAAGGPFGASDFWRMLNDMHRAQLRDRGFEHFKRTTNQTYFNWVVSDANDPQYRAVRSDASFPTRLRAHFARIQPGGDIETGFVRERSLSDPKARQVYATYVALLWEFVRRRDRLGALQRLHEPELGDPILVRYRGRLVSQDIANSVLEMNAVADVAIEPLLDRGVLELG